MPGIFFYEAAEIIRILNSDCGGHLRKAQPGIFQQAAGMIYLDTGEIGLGG